MAKIVENGQELENKQADNGGAADNERQPQNNGNKPRLTQKQKLIIICAAAAVAVILAIVIPIAVVFGGKKPVEKYTVTFDTQGGSAIESYTLQEGEIINKPATDPTQDMFIFDGWYTDTTYATEFAFGAEMPAHDVTIYAYWLGEYSVEVKFDANGGVFAGDKAIVTSSGKVGASFTAIENPTRFGYVFGGWYTDAECYSAFNAATYPAESFTLYAGWNKNEASFAYVSFYGNGKLLAEVPVEKGGKLPEYTFAEDVVSGKWYTESTMLTEYTQQTVSANVSLYTAMYTKGLVFAENGSSIVVTGYTGTSSTVIVPSVYNGKNVTAIGEYAFYRSDEYEENHIGSIDKDNDSEVKIGHIKEIVIPATVVTIREGAFYDCRYLVKVSLSNRVRTIGDNAFWHNERITDIGDISNVTTIGNGAFAGCSVLRNVTLPGTLTSLGNYAFADCAELRDIVIPENVDTVGEYAFDGCKQLVSVDIQSANLKTIGAYAFRNCASLETVTIRSAKVPQIVAVQVNRSYYSPFTGCVKVKIGVSATLLDSYKTSFGDYDDGALKNKFTA